MTKRKTERNRFLGVQILFVAAFATAFAILPAQSNTTGARTVPGSPFTDVAAPERQVPLKVGPLYDDADVVSDEQLAAVLERVRPRFSRSNLKPNFVEHALRTWGVAATFSEPGIMSGIELRDVLVDHGRFLQSWNDETEPLPDENVS